MKKLKSTLTALFVLVLVSGLWYKNAGFGKPYKTTEFLFDTTCSVTAYGKDAKKTSEEAFLLIEEIHNLTNFFSNSSDVARINKASMGEVVKINKMTAEILDTALEICEKSNGAFDITIAPLSALWDFKRENPTVPNVEEIKSAVKKVDYTKIVLNKNNLTVTKKADVKIDLGAAAKGYACDMATEIFKRNGIPAIIDLGGNVSCIGKNPKTKNGMWRVGLQTPFEATGNFDKTIEIASGSVVTSGTYQRFFEENDQKYHHIIDPETGYPKKADYNAVTVINESSLLGDCLSTACFVLGEEDGKKLAEEYKSEIYYY